MTATFEGAGNAEATLEARNVIILNVGLLDLYQPRAKLVTLLKDILEQRDQPRPWLLQI